MSVCKLIAYCSVFIIFINLASSGNRRILEFIMTFGRSLIKILKSSENTKNSLRYKTIKFFHFILKTRVSQCRSVYIVWPEQTRGYLRLKTLLYNVISKRII